MSATGLVKTNHIVFRKYEPGDEDSILQLHKTTFGNTLSKEYWNWKFLKNPAKKIYIYLAFDRSLCIGQYAMLPMSLCYNGRTVDTLIALDNMVHPKYQRRGILKDLEKLVVKDRPKDIPFYTFLNQNSFHVYTKKFGWVYLGTIDVYFKPISLNTFVATNRIYKPIELSFKLYNFFYRPKLKLHLEKMDKPDKDIEYFWDKNRCKFGITFNRSTEYLNWRFFECPLKYENLKIKHAGEVVGLAVIRIQKKFGFKIGWVMDLITKGNYEEGYYRDALLYIQNFVKEKCDFISILLPSENAKESLKSAGYRKIPQKLLPHQFYFCVRKNDYSCSMINEKKNWYFSWSLNDVL